MSVVEGNGRTVPHLLLDGVEIERFGRDTRMEI
jgi:hypothetical protein